ncbi:CHC2 zinc finger domain-containing protein [Marinilabilia salmonicolor]|uniref:CHC2 zinc finger domain-containing protein n=1 Tax=Marinilabilia salmonicolor TaxID=989 RepID=UPI000299E802|nr:CHC2 zinc finger domain-containing protein [Marinilabilia salmonicolor]
MTNWINLKENLSISKVISEETGLKIRKNGATVILSSCPFCGSGNGPNKSSAFSIKNDRMYKCFACDQAGDVVNFIAGQRQVSDGAAIKYLLNKYGDGLKKASEIHYSEWEKRLYAIKNNSKTEAVSYLEHERSINANILPKGCFYYDSIRKAIVFPSHNEQLLNLRFLNPERGKSKAINLTNGPLVRKKDCLYSACFNKNEKTVFITEGVINALSLFPYSSISIFDSGNKIELNLLTPFVQNKNVVLAFDDDDAGEKAFRHYSDLIKNANISLEIRKLILPESNEKRKDINDLLIEGKLEHWLKQNSSYQLLYSNRILNHIKETSEDIEEMWNTEGYYKKCGKYYGRDRKGNKRELSNFLMDIIYHFPDGSKNSLRYVKFQSNESGQLETNFTLLDAETLTSIQKFKTAIFSISELQFFGTSRDFEIIKKGLGKKTLKAIRIETLGWSQKYGIYIFSNAVVAEDKIHIIDQFGIVTLKQEKLFLPAWSEIYKEKDAYEAQRDFIYKETSIDLDMFETLIETAFQEKGIIGFLFLLSTVFSDIIFRDIGFFPILFLYGTSGSGKSSFTNFLLGLFGKPQTPLSLSGPSTEKAVLRKLSQYSNALIFLNEYKSDNAGKNDDLIVNIYDRVSYETAMFSDDNRTTQRKICSGVIIDGNFLPVKHPRTYSRLIQLDFMDKSYSEEQEKAYKRLEDILIAETFSGLLTEILKFRKIMDAQFRQVYYKVVNDVKKEYAEVQFDNRILVNYCVLLSSLKLLKNPLKLNMEYEKTKQILMKTAKVQQSILTQTGETEQFFEAIETNLHTGELHSKHLLDPACLHLHFATAYMVYAEHMQKTGGLAIDKQAMKKLLMRHPYFIEDGAAKKINGKTYRVISFDLKVLPLNI